MCCIYFVASFFENLGLRTKNQPYENKIESLYGIMAESFKYASHMSNKSQCFLKLKSYGQRPEGEDIHICIL